MVWTGLGLADALVVIPAAVPTPTATTNPTDAIHFTRRVTTAPPLLVPDSARGPTSSPRCSQPQARRSPRVSALVRAVGVGKSGNRHLLLANGSGTGHGTILGFP